MIIPIGYHPSRLKGKAVRSEMLGKAYRTPTLDLLLEPEGADFTSPDAQLTLGVCLPALLQ